MEDDDDRHQDDHEVQVREGQVQLPHCDEGREKGELETTDHLLNSCSAYSDLREGIDPELVIEDRAQFLTRAIGRRKELEIKLKDERTGSPSIV